MAGIFLFYNNNIDLKNIRSSFHEQGYNNFSIKEDDDILMGSLSNSGGRYVLNKNNIDILFYGNFFTGTDIDNDPKYYIYNLYRNNKLADLSFVKPVRANFCKTCIEICDFKVKKKNEEQ